jgi:hypothetical protein
VVLGKLELYYKSNFADLVYGNSLIDMEKIEVEIGSIADRLREEEL